MIGPSVIKELKILLLPLERRCRRLPAFYRRTVLKNFAKSTEEKPASNFIKKTPLQVTLLPPSDCFSNNNSISKIIYGLLIGFGLIFSLSVSNRGEGSN